MAYAAIANGGTLYVPQLVERVSAPNGAVIEEFPPRARQQIAVSPEHMKLVVDGLRGVVNDSKGTAYEVRGESDVLVAGKTGTAQVSRTSPKPGEDPKHAWYHSRDHAWFAGFAPADAPEVAIVVLVEHGGGGGKYAAPVAIDILHQYLGGSAPLAAAETKAHKGASRTGGPKTPTSVVATRGGGTWH
jgi:penicillin-binding protein 2